MDEQNGPSGSYTDENGIVHQLEIINDEVSITFGILNDVSDKNNETAYTLVDVVFDGWRSTHVSMSIYQDIIDFCQKKINEIPHWEVSDGKAEWSEEKK